MPGKKCHQAQGKTQAYEDAQKTAEEISETTEEAYATSQNQCAAASSSPPEAPQKEIPTTTLILSSSSSDSDESSYEESDPSMQKGYPSEASPNTTTLHQDLIASSVVILLQHLLHNYNLKQFTTKEEMLRVITKKHENDFPEILWKASVKLEDAFAVEVREVNSSQPSYNLISKLKLPTMG